jgi:hypothetical protein
MIEQRKNQRFDLRLPIEILGEKSHRPRGETMNVSSCGVLFTTPESVHVGDPIEYVITLPKASGVRVEVRLRCMGKVVRSDDTVRGDEAVPGGQPVVAFAATLERYEFVRGKV